jgi:hypothetical protein
MRGAILIVTVPAMIITSACRGVGRRKMPKRSRSNRPAKVAIISIAQQARPKVSGHMLDFCAHRNSASDLTSAIPPPGKRTTSSATSSRRCAPSGGLGALTMGRESSDMAGA